MPEFFTIERLQMHRFVRSESDWQKIIDMYSPENIRKMEKNYSEKTIEILSVGILLWSSGSNNWALTKQQALDALIRLERETIPVLGGDVFTRVNGDLVTNYNERYDFWSIKPLPDESKSEYCHRGAIVSKEYIEKYVPWPQYTIDDTYFALTVEPVQLLTWEQKFGIS